VVGLAFGAAQQQLSARGLLVDVKEASDPRQPDNLVLSQDPAEGASVAPRTVVRLVVNKLPQASVSVPNVGGLEEPEARKVLEKEGLKVAVDRAPGRKGVVIDQSPQPGVKVAPGTEVKIVIGS
jgi:serine/threonine-protein kinase